MSKKSYKIILISIILLALIIRIIYVVKMPMEERQHDFDMRYITTIYTTGHLPDSNKGQFYHPPFHQIICANVIKIETFFMDDLRIETAFENLQFITLIYSMILVRNYI